ncbi:MAG: hypothetical protein ACTSWY_05830 [Promethearchaeota archaeon]
MSKKLNKNSNKEWESQLKKTFPQQNKEKSLDIQDGNNISYKPINIGAIEGKLITKKTAVGTLSEGVVYYILPTDQFHKHWDELLVRKKTRLWQNDPQLHPFIDKMVKIKGDIIETRKSITVDCIEIWEIKEE